MTNTLPRKIAIKEYWPKLKVAEHEVISRIEKALSNLNYELLKIDENGYRLDNGELIAKEDALFCLDLHFLTPKVFPGISVGALWSPPDYYALFGLASSLRNQFSHDFYVAANPKRAVDLLSMTNPQIPYDVLVLNHTVPNGFLEPQISSTLGVFYIGIGWDKTAGYKARHHDLLNALENLVHLEIFGPKVLADGSRPWAAFRSYKGSLPFDGNSVLQNANRSGIVLALSSESHRAAGIVSNRIFEAIAGGAIPIIESDLETPFNLDEAITIDSSKSVEEIALDISREVSRLNNHKLEFQSRVLALQAKLSSGFLLEDQLERIVDKASLIYQARWSEEKFNVSRCFSIVECLREYLNLPKGVGLSQDQFMVCSSLPFQTYLAAALDKSEADWVSLLDGETLEEAEFSQTSKDAEVLLAPAVWSMGVGHQFEAVPGDSKSFGAAKIILRKNVVASWLASDSRVLTVTLLWKLVSLDLMSETPILNRGSLTGGLLRLSNSQTYSVDSLLAEWDLYILEKKSVPVSLSATGKLLLASASVNYSNIVLASPKGALNYRDILKALAGIPIKEIPRLAYAGLRHLIRGFRN